MSFSCIKGGECVGCGECQFPDYDEAEDLEEEVMDDEEEEPLASPQ